MTLDSKIKLLNLEQREIYNIIKTGSEVSKNIPLKIIYLNSTKPKASVRRVIFELKELGLVAKGESRGFFRIITEEETIEHHQ